MKKLLLYMMLVISFLGCDDSDTHTTGSENSMNLEGCWYISHRPGIYNFQEDYESYKYDEKVLGYEEVTFKLMKGAKNVYLISEKMRYVGQKENESDEDYMDRIENGHCVPDELVDYNVNCPSWKVSGRDIYIPGKYIEEYAEEDETFLVSKIVEWSDNEFTIASVSPVLWDYTLEDPLSYTYHITFTKIGPSQ